MNDTLKFVAVIAAFLYGAVIPLSLAVAYFLGGGGYTWADIGFIYLVLTIIFAFCALIAAALIYVMNRI